MQSELSQFFKYEHLPVEKQGFLKPFGEAVKVMFDDDYKEYLYSLSEGLSGLLPVNLESNEMRDKIEATIKAIEKAKKLKGQAVRLLLEAKDCAVRSSFMK